MLQYHESSFVLSNCKAIRSRLNPLDRCNELKNIIENFYVYVMLKHLTMKCRFPLIYHVLACNRALILNPANIQLYQKYVRT